MCGDSNRDEARAYVFDYMLCFCKTKRWHVTLSRVSPAAFETQ